MTTVCAKPVSTVKLDEDIFDIANDNGSKNTVKRFTWTNGNKMQVQVISYGATITSIKIPDKNGVVNDIVLGFDDNAGYRSVANRYFGATIGRVGNRIGYAKFSIGNQQYQLASNFKEEHQLHGGFKGFDKYVWDDYVNGTKLVLSHHSPDGDEGFPGNVLVNLTFELTNDNQFIVDYEAVTTKPTYINMTNHSYFNLAGDHAGAEELYKHVISINANRITEVDSNAIPTGILRPVAGTVFDLQIPTVLGDVINKVPGNPGYDHNFCINKGVDQELTFISRVYHPPSGRTMEVYSDQPGVQFYTSNFLPEDPKLFKGDPTTLAKLLGKNGKYYHKHGALCLETQNYPDPANHENFPKAIYYPGETYKQKTYYKFYVTA